MVKEKLVDSKPKLGHHLAVHQQFKRTSPGRKVTTIDGNAPSPSRDISTSRRNFLRFAALALAGGSGTLEGAGKLISGSGVANITNPTAFGRLCARMTTHAAELVDVDAALSGTPETLFSTLSGIEEGEGACTAGQAIFQAHRVAGAAVYPESHLGTVLALQGTEDAALELGAEAIPRTVTESFVAELKKCPADRGDFSHLIEDPASVVDELRYSWTEARNLLNEIGSSESWIQGAGAAVPENLAPAVNLMRQSLQSPASRAALLQDAAFLSRVQVVDYLQAAEELALKGEAITARFCIEKARDLKGVLGDSLGRELAGEVDKRLTRIERDMLSQEAPSASEHADNSLAKLSPPALPSLALLVSYRAIQSDVFLVRLPRAPALIFYLDERNIPWVEPLRAQLNSQVRELAGEDKQSSKPEILFIEQGRQLSEFGQKFSPVIDSKRIGQILDRLEVHMTREFVGAEARSISLLEC